MQNLRNFVKETKIIARISYQCCDDFFPRTPSEISEWRSVRDGSVEDDRLDKIRWGSKCFLSSLL
jgi:hypothetical protein